MDKNMRETLRIAALTALWRLKPQKATQPMLLLMFSDETSPVLRANAVKVLSRIQALSLFLCYFGCFLHNLTKFRIFNGT